MSTTLTIKNTTKSKLPRLPFQLMKDAVLGADYELSLVFVGPRKSQALNKEYRGKDKPTDILSFPIAHNEGEIFIDLATTAKKAPEFDRTLTNFIAFLFIHGLVHLKGFDHGSKMEHEEKKFRKMFSI